MKYIIVVDTPKRIDGVKMAAVHFSEVLQGHTDDGFDIEVREQGRDGVVRKMAEWSVQGEGEDSDDPVE